MSGFGHACFDLGLTTFIVCVVAATFLAFNGFTALQILECVTIVVAIVFCCLLGAIIVMAISARVFK